MKSNSLPIISLSTGSVRFACERNLLVDFVGNTFGSLIDGMELCFILKEDFDDFEPNEKDICFLNRLKFNTLHAPVKGINYGPNRETKQVLEKISRLNKKVKLGRVVIHPDHVDDFLVLANSGLNISIENLPCGEKRNGWEYPGELKAFFEKWPEFGFCFDVNHALANGVEPKEFISALGERITHVHLNATAKPGNAGHNLLIESAPEVIEKIRPVLKLNKPLVIEVSIEKEKIPLIASEIRLIRSLAGK